jgi:hypothetical protein
MIGKNVAAAVTAAFLLAGCQSPTTQYAERRQAEYDANGVISAGMRAGFYPGRMMPRWRDTIAGYEAANSEIIRKVDDVVRRGDDPGCIGSTVAECIASLASQYIVTTTGFSGTIVRQPEQDVLGRTAIDSFTASVSIFPPRVTSLPSGGVTVTIFGAAKSDRVSGVIANLPEPLLFRRTERDFEGSFVFPLVDLILPAQCRFGAALKAYQFVAMQSDQAESAGPRVRSSATEASVFESNTARGELCGLSVTVSDGSGTSISTVSGSVSYSRSTLSIRQRSEAPSVPSRETKPFPRRRARE